MSISDETYHILSIAAGWLGSVVVVVALFAGWLKQRIPRWRKRRCPKCWYDLSHTEGLRCSECGYTAKRERKLFKGRRRWRWAIVGIVLLLGSYALHVTPAVKQRGWVTAVPTTALILVAPVDKDAWVIWPFGDFITHTQPMNPLLGELFFRLDQDALYAWQWRILLERYYELNPDHLAQIIQTRSRWPEDARIDMKLRCPSGLLAPQRDRVKIRARLENSAEAWHAWPAHEMRSQQLSLGVPDQSCSTVDVELEILIDERPVWNTIHTTASIVPDVREILSPIQPYSGDATVNLLNALEPALIGRGSNTKLGLLTFAPPFSPDTAAWSLAGRFTVLRDGQPVADGELIYGASHRAGRYQKSRYYYETFDTRWLVEPPSSQNGSTWELKFESDPNIALYDLDHSTYWAGHAVVPIVSLSQATPDS